MRAETKLLQENLKQAEAKAAKVAELEAKLSAAEAQMAVIAKPAQAPEAIPVSTAMPKAVPKVAVKRVPKVAPIPVSEPISDLLVAESVVDAIESEPEVNATAVTESVLETTPEIEISVTVEPSAPPKAARADAAEPVAEVNVVPVTESALEAAPEIEGSATAEPRAPPKATKGERAPVKRVTQKAKTVRKGKVAKTTTAKAAPPLETPIPAEKPPPEPINGDVSWASLSEASLKRKTVKELSEFLAAKVSNLLFVALACILM